MLARCYLIHGGEPCQTEEIIASINQLAAKEGYNKKAVFEVNANFVWEGLLNECQNLDLFAERTLVELRLHSDTVHKQGSKILESILQQQDQALCIIIRAGKLQNQTVNSTWAKIIQKTGKIQLAKPISQQQWPAWLAKKLAEKGFTPHSDTLEYIAKSYEGNLLAAKQFIGKIAMVLPKGPLTVTQIIPYVETNNNFAVFELINAALNGNKNRTYQVWQQLKISAEPLLVLWALSKEVRQLITIKHNPDAAQELGLWQESLLRIKSASARLSMHKLTQLIRLAKTADFIIKGVYPGNIWEHLLTMSLILSGEEIITMGESDI